jgi:hypothetical protein
MPRKTPSEQRFERYLEAQGHAFEFEPDLGTHFKPDYKVLLGATGVVVEVKEFKTNWLTERLSPIGAADARRPTRAVRKGVRRAVEQVGELAGHGLPLVIVVSNPHQADVDLDPERVWATLYYDDGPLQDNRADHVRRSRSSNVARLCRTGLRRTCVASARSRRCGLPCAPTARARCPRARPST